MKKRFLIMVLLVAFLVPSCSWFWSILRPTEGPEFAEEVGKKLFTCKDWRTGKDRPISKEWGYKVLAYGKGEFNGKKINWAAYHIKRAGRSQLNVFLNRRIPQEEIRELMEKEEGETLYLMGYPSIPKSTLITFKTDQLPKAIEEMERRGITLEVIELI